MLFDLRGRRKRAVQVIYALLAVLMGGGLILFGVGGGTSGGFLDAFTGGGGGGGNEVVEKRIEAQEKRLAANPDSKAALRDLVRDYYQLATGRIPEGSSVFPPESQSDLHQAANYWQRYAKAADGKPDPSLANLAAQLYGPDALNQPGDAQEAYRIIAERVNNTPAYLQLIAAAVMAGDNRTVQLASLKAIDLAPKKARKAVEKQIKQVKKQAKEQAQAQAGSTAGGS